MMFHRVDKLKKFEDASYPRTGVAALQNNSQVLIVWIVCGNDPSAGSPTETLLRLHLPLREKIRAASRRTSLNKGISAAIRRPHLLAQSVGATGGVYKRQGRNQCELMTRVY